jgi:hypothetical protein
MQQFERIERYLERIRGIYRGQPHYLAQKECYEDDVISFFIHCHHMCDWVTQLNKARESKESVNAFINSHAELKVCADLCNQSKHCKIQRVRGSAKPYLSYRSWELTVFTPESREPPIFKSRYKIICGNTIYDALELAETCFALWSEYIQALRLRFV